MGKGYGFKSPPIIAAPHSTAVSIQRAVHGGGKRIYLMSLAA